jgi:hypothetical protein
MDKRHLEELCDVLDDTRGDIVQAKVQAAEGGDESARLWLIAKCIFASQRKRGMTSAVALEHALRLTGYEPSDLG